jgi:hypothetical protein
MDTVRDATPGYWAAFQMCLTTRPRDLGFERLRRGGRSRGETHHEAMSPLGCSTFRIPRGVDLLRVRCNLDREHREFGVCGAATRGAGTRHAWPASRYARAEYDQAFASGAGAAEDLGG